MNVINTITVNDNIIENMDFGAIALPAQSNPTHVFPFTNGVVASTIDTHWEKSGTTAVTLAAAASVTYTLSALTDDLGRTVAFVEIAKVYVRITSKTAGTANYLSIGNATTNPWGTICSSTTATIPCRSAILFVADDATGFAVAVGTADQLKIKNDSSASVTFEIRLSGRTA